MLELLLLLVMILTGDLVISFIKTYPITDWVSRLIAVGVLIGWALFNSFIAVIIKAIRDRK